MTALAALTRADVEDFLYREAELLDAWELDDWLQLYTADARYVIPCTGDPAGDPSRDLVLIDDDRLRLQARVERLNSRKAHREYPHSNTGTWLPTSGLAPPKPASCRCAPRSPCGGSAAGVRPATSAAMSTGWCWTGER
jgi:Ring hydroxylating beta subunit